MHQIQLSEQLYLEVQVRASEAGFESVDEYVADVLSQELVIGGELPESFFTPERLAQIAVAEEEIKRGEFYTLEEADAELARLRTEWARRNQAG